MSKQKILLVLSCVFPLFLATVTQADTNGVQIIKLADRLRIEINGQLFTEYFYQNVHCPYYYPLLGPDNLPMTRKWPMESPLGEEHDHPHHRSLWFSHGSVNGQDFWTDRPGTGKILDDGLAEISSGKEFGVIRSHDKWVAADGRVLCTDDRDFKVYNPGSADERMFDFEITIHASHGDVVFGDSKEGTMALRVAETMKLKGPVGRGHIVESTGLRDETTWGRRADWCDCSGPVQNETVGIAIFDHPENPSHPTWWMVRDYGLFAANPFGQHSLESLAVADLKIPSGKSVTFRYRFYLHLGDEKQARVAERYEQYSKSE